MKIPLCIGTGRLAETETTPIPTKKGIKSSSSILGKVGCLQPLRRFFRRKPREHSPNLPGSSSHMQETIDYSKGSIQDRQFTSDAQRKAYQNMLDQRGDEVRARETAKIVAVKEQVELLQKKLPQIRETRPWLAEQIDQLILFFNYALLSEDVYHDSTIEELLPSGFSRLDEEQLAQVGLNATDLKDPASGYFAAVYRDNNTDRYIFVNRGTEEGFMPGTAG